MMACVRDIFFNPAPKRDQQGFYSGPFKLWVEWMERSSMRGLDHFLLYSFEGTDLAARKVMQPYVDAGLATRVHFNFFLESELIRQGYVANDCLFRAKNHAKWLVTCVDVDEYIAFPGPVKCFDWDEVVKLEGVQPEQVASLSIPRMRFARPRPKALEISSVLREPEMTRKHPQQVVLVENVYRTSVHNLTHFRNGTSIIEVNPDYAVIHHCRIPEEEIKVNYADYDFYDVKANIIDHSLQQDVLFLTEAIRRRFQIQDGMCTISWNTWCKNVRQQVAMQLPFMSCRREFDRMQPCAA